VLFAAARDAPSPRHWGTGSLGLGPGGVGAEDPQFDCMAQTEHLPLYKAAYDLCLYFKQVVRNFSRYHKFGLGTDLRDGARKVLRLIVRANGRRDKVPVLLEIRETVEELKVAS